MAITKRRVAVLILAAIMAAVGALAAASPLAVDDGSRGGVDYVVEHQSAAYA